MIRRPPRSTRTDTLFPYTTLFRSLRIGGALSAVIRNQLPVAYGCDGQRVPEDIEPGRANSLVLRAMQLARTTPARIDDARSEEHTSELQSLKRLSYAVFCLKKKKKQNKTQQPIR